MLNLQRGQKKKVHKKNKKVRKNKNKTNDGRKSVESETTKAEMSEMKCNST